MSINFRTFKVKKNQFFISLVCFVFYSNLFAQSVSVTGKISSNRFPMKQVQVTFVDNSDGYYKDSSIE